jgi:FAD synthase
LEEGTPEKIAQSQKARKIYLGDGFELGGKRRGKEDEKKELSHPLQGRLWD